MFAQIRIIGRCAGRLLRTLLLPLLAAIAGCDREPRWRGVGTAAGEAPPAPNPAASPGSNGHGNAP